MLAEDDDLMLRALEFRLKKDGHEIMLTRNGLEAIEKFKQFNPELIITDIMMPFSSGLEIVGTVRKHSKVPIIVLSGMGQESVVTEAFKLGADDYMTKPFSPNELSIRVRRFM